jgi:hypothetical protein
MKRIHPSNAERASDLERTIAQRHELAKEYRRLRKSMRFGRRESTRKLQRLFRNSFGRLQNAALFARVANKLRQGARII